ncbi:MAG: hypothetical protein JNM62_00375 [Flavobacteriales bacterium]|nr:hypothetical protein [Flavobacteriales bacterium]
MAQHLIILFFFTIATSGSTQDIHFSSDVELAMNYYADLQPLTIGHCVDSLVTDTVYVENINTGELDMVVHRYPDARYEFYLDGALFRRMDLGASSERYDTLMTENLETGELEVIVQAIRIDIPNGAYHEFFPNGNIRIKGTLDGYNADGTLKKTGEWKEWDANGNVIRQETYP